mmetsp:Transcript_38442/g.97552  ORF Transcript_38442/g.97552 Transcript_38442/m.97552 type:complete len:211 (+) Transcript_38442:485-1117(+)
MSTSWQPSTMRRWYISSLPATCVTTVMLASRARLCRWQTFTHTMYIPLGGLVRDVASRGGQVMFSMGLIVARSRQWLPSMSSLPPSNSGFSQLISPKPFGRIKCKSKSSLVSHMRVTVISPVFAPTRFCNFRISAANSNSVGSRRWGATCRKYLFMPQQPQLHPIIATKKPVTMNFAPKVRSGEIQLFNQVGIMAPWLTGRGWMPLPKSG